MSDLALNQSDIDLINDNLNSFFSNAHQANINYFESQIIEANCVGDDKSKNCFENKLAMQNNLKITPAEFTIENITNNDLDDFLSIVDLLDEKDKKLKKLERKISKILDI